MTRQEWFYPQQQTIKLLNCHPSNGQPTEPWFLSPLPSVIVRRWVHLQPIVTYASPSHRETGVACLQVVVLVWDFVGAWHALRSMSVLRFFGPYALNGSEHDKPAESHRPCGSPLIPMTTAKAPVLLIGVHLKGCRNKPKQQKKNINYSNRRTFESPSGENREEGGGWFGFLIGNHGNRRTS